MSQRTLTLAITLILGCATGAATSQLLVPPARAGTAPTRWEYACTPNLQEQDGGVDAATRKYGEAGWEMVAASHEHTMGGPHEWAACFKRALP